MKRLARGPQLGDPDIGQRNRAAADAHAEKVRLVESLTN
jgi:hypothetical protein